MMRISLQRLSDHNPQLELYFHISLANDVHGNHVVREACEPPADKCRQSRYESISRATDQVGFDRAAELAEQEDEE
jgi:hypothetical protein